MKYLLYLSVVIFAISCSKEEPTPAPSNDNAELESSVWAEDLEYPYTKEHASISINAFGYCRYSYTSLLTGNLFDSDLEYVYNKPNITFKYKNSDTIWGEGQIYENGDGINDKIIYLGEMGVFTCYCFDGVYDFLND